MANDSLPDEAFGVKQMDGSLIKIKKGASGYLPLEKRCTDDGLKHYNLTNTSDLADKLNEEEGVTKYQRKAMEMGSMFGWNTPAADPVYWENNDKKKG